jgi:DNA polymerase-3 subunit alpha
LADETKLTLDEDDLVVTKRGKIRIKEVSEKDLIDDKKIEQIKSFAGKPKKDSLPDIDEDFASSKRDEVKRYMEEKFGKEHVVSIGTFGRMKLRSIIKDFAREKGFSFEYVNKITKNIDDQVEGYEWGDLFRYGLKDPILYDFIQKNPTLINNIKQVLNNPRSSSIHPSALIIVPKVDKNGQKTDLFNLMPVRAIDGILVCEWEGKYTDIVGFLKEDILGIKQLDKFDDILKLIKKNRGIKVVLEEIDLDENDEEVFEAFSNGYNEDVFQFGSFGLKNYSREVKPENLEDLIAMNALYRPATMDVGSHKEFALIKQGKKKPKYDFGLEEVTKSTNGLYIYQEQLMKTCVVLGQFSGAEAEATRTACKKYDRKALTDLKEKFIIGATNQGCPEDEADKIWEKMIAFASYGFNKCIPLDIKISLKDGTKKTVEELLNGDFSEMEFVSLIGDEIISSKLKTIHKNGIKKLFKITLSNGQTVRATENHKFMTHDGVYKEVSNLKIGDKLKIIK